LVALDGRLDLEGTGEIDLQFTSRTVAQRKPTVIDLAGVVFLASIGMRMLATAAKSLNRYGHPCVLLNPRENVRDALEMAGLGRSFSSPRLRATRFAWRAGSDGRRYERVDFDRGGSSSRRGEGL